MLPTCDEIIDNLFLGNYSAASNIKLLQNNKITHIVVAAFGLPQLFPEKFTYKALQVIDFPTENISRYFDETAKWIEKAIESKGRVFVHCLAGVSRSSSIVISYLIYKGMPYSEAFNHCKRKHKDTFPNYGFQRQLINFELKTKKNNLIANSSAQLAYSSQVPQSQQQKKPIVQLMYRYNQEEQRYLDNAYRMPIAQTIPNQQNELKIKPYIQRNLEKPFYVKYAFNKSMAPYPNKQYEQRENKQNKTIQQNIKNNLAVKNEAPIHKSLQKFTISGKNLALQNPIQPGTWQKGQFIGKQV